MDKSYYRLWTVKISSLSRSQSKTDTSAVCTADYLVIVYSTSLVCNKFVIKININ